jgi:ubiquinol-cytochrome c reductase iron-sulfur subunit
MSRLRAVLGWFVAEGVRHAPAPGDDDEAQEERVLYRVIPSTPRSEGVVAALLVAAAVAFCGFVVAYALGASTQWLGAMLGGGLVLVAAALVAAGKLVVPQEVMDEPRPGPAPAGEAEQTAAALAAAGDGISRRRLLSLAGAGAAVTLGAAAVVPLFSTAEGTGGATGSSPWQAGVGLVDEDGVPVRADPLVTGSFLTAFPRGVDPEALGSPVIVCAVDPSEIHPAPDRAGWAVNGIQAFSKICTHAGCAVAMLRYPLDAQVEPGPALVCPCHYSTFDVLHGARVVFGPAGRPLPQLPLRLAADGTLEAAGPMSGPVGPAWWGIDT